MADKRVQELKKRNVVLGELTVEYVDIKQLRPNPWNPNRQSEHDFELLCKSIAMDGFTQPVFVMHDRMIIDGEHRWRACMALGHTEIPIVVAPPNMTQDQARIACLRMNRARGEEVAGLAADLLRELAEMGDISLAADELLLDPVETERLLKEIADDSAADLEKFEPELPADITATAADKRRSQEEQLAEAKRGEESSMLAADARVYRLLLVYSGEQGEAINRVLEADKAGSILRLCQAAQARVTKLGKEQPDG